MVQFLIWLFVGFIVLILLGAPLSYGLFLSSVLALVTSSNLPMVLILQQMEKGIDTFPILAIPIFFFAGDLMNKGKISDHLIKLCMTFLGWMRGSLAYLVVVVSMIFAGTTGSSAAESAAMGSLFIPNLVKHGYGRGFSAAIVACSSVIGIIIPPSTFLIIYGSYGNVSVVALFIGGILPGILIGGGLIGISAFYAKKYHYPKERERIAPPREILSALKMGVWPMGVPVLLIGGMVAGIFTATEASLVTVVYIILLLLFVYKTVKPSKFFGILKENALSSAIPLFCLSCAGVYGYLLAFYKVPDIIGNSVLSVTQDPHLIMLFIIVAFLVIGTFMDGTPAIVILLPITQKLGTLAGINSLHLGIVVCVTIALGLLTPPYGLCTLISCSIAKIGMGEILPPLFLMFAYMLVVVLILALFPDLALFLPRLMVPDLVPLM
jgi:tripartite ATP-independent transporter DctM subunit